MGCDSAGMAWGRRMIGALSAVSAIAVLLAAAAAPASAQPMFFVNDPTDAPDAHLADGRCDSTNTSPAFRSCTLRSAMWRPR